MLTLHKYVPAWGLPDLSPFCIKVETYLRMAKIPFETTLGDPRKAPKGKLPFIEHAGTRLGDSTLIIDYLKAQFGDALDGGLTPRDEAQCQALQSLLEEHLYFVLLYERWKTEPSWAELAPVLREHFRKAGVPSFIHPLLLVVARKSVLRSLQMQGMGRHTPEQVTALGKRLIDTVSELLGERAFYCGEQPRSIDAALFGFISPLLIDIDTPLVRHASSKTNLRAYRDRMRAAFYASGSA